MAREARSRAPVTGSRSQSRGNTDFIQGVLPELQRRGLAQTEYAPGTLREKVFGRGPKLEPTHPAARYRGAFSDLSAAATVKAGLAPVGA